MGIRLRAGRFFDGTDNAGSTPVVVVNEELVRRFFDGRNPVGRRIDPGSGVMSTIIGVAGSTRQIIESPPMPELYTFAPQSPRQLTSLTYVVASRANPLGLLPAVRATFHELAPTQALFRVGTLDDVIPESLRARKLVLSLLGIFAALAMALSAAGVYGVTSYAVSRRTREIGIRIALGADAGRVMGMILGEVLRVVGVGAVIGLAVALVGSGVMRSLLFGIGPIDPPSMLVAVAIVLGAGVIAALLPARRASGISPTIAIRSD
jgi:putative ABC transport system permease protein